MPRRLFKAIAGGLAGGSRAPSAGELRYALTTEDTVWVMGSFCALNRKPFDADLLVRQFPPPYSTDSLIHASRALWISSSTVRTIDTQTNEVLGELTRYALTGPPSSGNPSLWLRAWVCPPPAGTTDAPPVDLLIKF